MAQEVVLPVFNGFEAVTRCVASLARHTADRYRVVLVDDASTDARIPPLLAAFAAGRANTVVLTNARNLGFTGAVNRGFAETSGDVVVLNSDTELTAGWMEGLARCRDSDAAIGIVCPLSNRATILSLPGVAELFTRPDGGADVDAIGRCVAGAAERSYPRLPTAVGFCMLVTRALLGAAGPFDAVYGRGYGEENDLSMRALDRGFEIACADDVYVHHAGEASFGAVSGFEAERARNAGRLERRWPMYAPGVAAWARANPLRRAAERANAQAEREKFPGRLRVLEVLHRYETRGGVEEHTRAMVAELKAEVSFNIAVPHYVSTGWSDFWVERLEPQVRLARMNPDLMQPGIRVIGHAASVRDAAVEGAFASLLAGGYDVVHFQSLIGWNSMRLPRLARDAGARVVLACHDLALACADYNMVVGMEARPCGRDAARGSDGGCVACLRTKSQAAATGAHPPIGSYIEERYAAACDAVDAADALVCPSEYVAARMRRAFGARVDTKIEIIGHGVRDFPLVYAKPDRSILRVAVLGHFNIRKGGDTLVEAARRLAGHGIAFEVWGPVEERLAAPARAAGVQLRGPYAADDLPRVLRGIDLVVVPTLLEESFCLVVSEAQRLGIPVAASHVGAIPERVREGETGFLFPPGDAKALAALVLRLRDDRAALERVAATLREERPRTHAENALDYLALYRRLRETRAPADREPKLPPLPDSRDVLRRAMHLPRRRLRTPLGSDAYDRWLAAEDRPFAAVASASMLTLLALSDDVRELNRSIADASTAWVALLEPGDVLAPDALRRMEEACVANARAALVYCDDDALSAKGERYDPAFKPAFSAELLRHRPYIAGLCALRRDRIVALGGLRTRGWAGVVDLALRLVESDGPHAIASLRALICHRLDVNLRALEDEDAVRAMQRVVSDHMRREGKRGTWLAPAGDAPGFWVHTAATAAPVSVLMRAAPPERIAPCLESLLQRTGTRIGELFLEADEQQCREVAEGLAARGIKLRIVSAATPSGSPLAQALRQARHEWVVVIDGRCDTLGAGWLERLEQGVANRSVAALAPDLSGDRGERLRGWEVLGAGPGAIAGPPSPIREPSAAADLYGSPREVSALSGRLAVIRRDAARASGALADMTFAGRFDMTHLGIALRRAGFDLLARPFLAARFHGASLALDPAPPEAAWMRARWPGEFDEDPYFRDETASWEV